MGLLGPDTRSGCSFSVVIFIILASAIRLCPACDTWEYKCANGECIKSNGRCDGRAHCGDGSDERGCPTVGSTLPWTPIPCSSEQFQCKNGRCVYPGWVCDGDDDCGDSSDEHNCPTAPSSIMNSASLIGMSVAVVGLLAVLGGIGIMLTCARNKLMHPHHQRARRRGGRVSRAEGPDMIGPYGGGFPPSADGLMVWREPPPRYTSQTDLSSTVPTTNNHGVINQAFTVHPDCPPPLYSSNPDISVIQCDFTDPPPSYTSRQDLDNVGYPSMDRGDRRRRGPGGNPRDPPEGSGYYYKRGDKKLGDDTLPAADVEARDIPGNPVVCVQQNTSVLQSSKAMTGSSDSLYEGLTAQEKELLNDIVQTVPEAVLQGERHSQNCSSELGDHAPGSPTQTVQRMPRTRYHLSMPEIPESHQPRQVRYDRGEHSRSQPRNKYQSSVAYPKARSLANLYESNSAVENDTVFSSESLEDNARVHSYTMSNHPSLPTNKNTMSATDVTNRMREEEMGGAGQGSASPQLRVLDARHLIQCTSSQDVSNC